MKLYLEIAQRAIYSLYFSFVVIRFNQLSVFEIYIYIYKNFELD